MLVQRPLTALSFVPALPVPDDPAVIAAKMSGLNASRRSMCAIGITQLCWGILGLCITFGWMSALLSLISGAILVSHTHSMDATKRFFEQRRSGGGNCCAPDSARGIAITIIVFAVLEIITFGAVLGIIISMRIFIFAAVNASGSTVVLTPWSVSYLNYLRMAFFLAPAWPIVSMILAIVILSTLDPFFQSGGSAIQSTLQARMNPAGVYVMPVQAQQQQVFYPAMGQPMQQEQQQGYVGGGGGGGATPISYGADTPGPQQQGYPQQQQQVYSPQVMAGQQQQWQQPQQQYVPQYQPQQQQQYYAPDQQQPPPPPPQQQQHSYAKQV